MVFVQVVCERADVLASACAVARALPLYCGKSNTTGFKRVVTVEFVLASSRGEEVLTDADVEAISVVAHGVRLAAKITDMPCSLMHTDAFLEVSFVWVCVVGFFFNLVSVFRAWSVTLNVLLSACVVLK